jgi:hypothetical protein
MSASIVCPLNRLTTKAYVDRVIPLVLECHQIGLKYQIFPATNGVQSKIPFTPNPTHERYWTAGCAGLVDTTLRLLKLSLTDPDIDSILIVEDDAQFDPDFNAIVERNLQHIPSDWEMVFFGMTRLKEGSPIAGNIVRIPPGGGYAAHCVAIRRSIFPILIEQFAKFEEPNDVTYCDRIFPRGRSYAFYPNLSFQRPGFSHILQEEVDYAHLRTSEKL